MMSVLHSDGTGGKAVAMCESRYLGSVIVSHQEIAGEMLALVKESFVVYLRMNVETTASALATGGVRRVNKEDRIGVVAMFGERRKGVALHESKPVSDVCDIAYATGKRRVQFT